jgi:hypothetical protein
VGGRRSDEEEEGQTKRGVEEEEEEEAGSGKVELSLGGGDGNGAANVGARSEPKEPRSAVERPSKWMTEWFRVEDEAKQKGVIINIIGPDRMNRDTMQETPGEATITGTRRRK